MIPSSDSKLIGETFAPSLAAVIWLAVYLFSTKIAFGSIYLFSSAFVVSLFLFHFGLVLQDGFGLLQVKDWLGPLGAWAVRAAWYTNIALSCIGIGLSIYLMRYKAKRPPSPELVERAFSQNRAWLYDQGIGLLLASALLLALSFATMGNIFALSRLELFHLSDTRFISVFSMMAPSAAIAMVIAAQSRSQKRTAYIAAALILLFFLLSGQRTTALFPLLTGIILWVKCGRRINPMLAGATLFAVLLLIPLIGYLRTLGTLGEIASVDAIAEATEVVDLRDSFGEMGGSIGPLMYTIMLIPEEESYRYGRTYLSYLLDVIPNIGLTADYSTSRAAAAEKIRGGATEEALFEMQAGDWATYHIIREQFEAGGGAGYSGVAEPYFNFGLIGILVFFIAMGAFLGQFECVPLLLHRYWFLFASTIFWHVLPIVRNGLAVFTKPAVFTLIVLLIWKFVRPYVPISKPRQPKRRKSAAVSSPDSADL